MKLTSRIEWVAEQVKGKDVLDVGCVGDIDIPNFKGAWLHAAISKCARSVLGIDTNENGVGKMRALGYDVICADAERFDANPRKFDVVVLGACEEHMDNSGLVFDCALKNLREGGRLIMTTPNARHLGIAMKDMVSDFHTHIYTPKLLSQMLDRHGFKIVRVQFFRDEGRLNLVGWLYEKLLLRIFPSLATKFGVIAEKSDKGVS